MATIVAVSNQKGGPGKTTTVIELGHWLASRGRSTLVIDTDPQANLTRSLVGRPAPSAITSDGARADGPANARRLYGGEDERPAQPLAVSEHLHLMGASRSLASTQNLDYEQIVFAFRDRVTRLAAEAGHEFVLIDCLPSLSPRLTASYAAADTVLVPTVLSDYSIDAVEELLITVRNVRATVNPRLTLLGVLRNCVSRRPKIIESIAAKDLEALVPEGRIFAARIHESAIIERLHALQLSTSTTSEKDARTRRVRDEVEALGTEFLERLERARSRHERDAPAGTTASPPERSDSRALPA